MPAEAGTGIISTCLQLIGKHGLAALAAVGIPLARVRLAVAQDNRAALTLYLGCGFVLADASASDGMLQMQCILPRPAIATTPNNVFLKINTLQFLAK